MEGSAVSIARPTDPAEAVADALRHVEEACALLEAHRRRWVEEYSTVARAGGMGSAEAARLAYLIQGAADAGLTRTVLRVATDLGASAPATRGLPGVPMVPADCQGGMG